MGKFIEYDEAERTPLYRRLELDWQDEEKVLSGLTLPSFQLFLVTSTEVPVVERRRVGIFRQRWQIRLIF